MFVFKLLIIDTIESIFKFLIPRFSIEIDEICILRFVYKPKRA